MKRILTSVLAALALVFAVTASQAEAGLIANWLDPAVISVTDPQSDQLSGPSGDILEIAFVQQGSNYYFLMVMDEAPSMKEYTPAYILNFDYQPGGANAADSYYVAVGLTGIDLLIDSHYFQDDLTSVHWHPFIGGLNPQFDTLDGSASPYNVVYNAEILGGNWHQEWQVPISALPFNTDFTFYGSTITAVGGPGAVTFDTTGPLNFTTVPEPATMALLALGALAAMKRRR